MSQWHNEKHDKKIHCEKYMKKEKIEQLKIIFFFITDSLKDNVTFLIITFLTTAVNICQVQRQCH